MPSAWTTPAAAAAVAVGGVAAVVRAAAARHGRVAADVRSRLEAATYDRVGDIGAVDRLSVLPLVERAVRAAHLRGEPGVSYLVRAGSETLLFDTGLNLGQRAASPLAHNAEALGVDLTLVPAVVLSHAHEDHVGGVRARRAGTFAYAARPMEPAGLTAFAPVPLRHARADVRVTARTTVIAPGIALLPPLPVALFWDDAPLLEQALVVNVRDVGLVVISGCGHPGVPLMLDVVARVLDAPVHGVVGGLHLPVRPWPTHLPQALSGSPHPPWRPLSDPEIDAAINGLSTADARVVAVSGHDSTGYAMRRFADVFGEGFREVRVGDEIVVGPAAA